MRTFNFLFCIKKERFNLLISIVSSCWLKKVYFIQKLNFYYFCNSLVKKDIGIDILLVKSNLKPIIEPSIEQLNSYN